ncbi:mitochondrial import inner membrane translocase subunit tim16-B-like protein [Lipomyces oligophaga]|uniref:mitochondrial import inner membrane translocase subunit tim16-B-like protein n=1 Tax=Lipomyces oligophaga TaxID=45792 RepID=UPI0034CFA96D
MAQAFLRVILVGGQIFGRALTQAVKQATANGAQGGTTRRGEITLEEACKILHIQSNSSASEVTKRFEHLFKVNSKDKGGSFYLQSKIFRAKERLDQELAKGHETSGPKTDPTGS